jgi:CheY-like chemotaxis protein
MPVRNGLEASSRLRKVFQKTPIIPFTLYGEDLSKADGSKAGETLVLEKTVPFSTLLDEAHELISN